jgi:branched-chain amino acid transport system permease protein
MTFQTQTLASRRVRWALTAGLAAAALALAWAAPQWLVFVLTLALAKGVVVLGLLLLMRTGLVSFGQGLYFGLGAYGAALLGHWGKIADAALMLLAGTLAAALIAAILGLLLARYRAIFFAMLSLAFSMILYGTLVKSSALGSTDGFNLHAKTFAGVALAAGSERRVFFAAGILAVAVAAWLLHRLLGSHWGRVSAAIRDNELRVDYLGASVYRVVYVNYVIAGALAGLGGSLAALAVGHVDPDTTYWTTSGEFVFIAVLGGTGNVIAPFLSAVIFEGLRTLASQYASNVWQMSLGLAMLAIIMFLPAGLWSLGRRPGRAA